MEPGSSEGHNWVLARVIAGVGALVFAAAALWVVGNNGAAVMDWTGAIRVLAPTAAAVWCGWFALFGHHPLSRGRLGYALTGGLVLGILGLVAGVLGSMIQDSKSTQGLLIGIFVTGPTGFVVGMAAGAVFALIAVRPEAAEEPRESQAVDPD